MPRPIKSELNHFILRIPVVSTYKSRDCSPSIVMHPPRGSLTACTKLKKYCKNLYSLPICQLSIKMAAALFFFLRASILLLFLSITISNKSVATAAPTQQQNKQLTEGVCSMKFILVRTFKSLCLIELNCIYLQN